MQSTHLLHYGTIALAVALNSIGVGIGDGITSLAALDAIDIQPHARPEISKTFILGMALIETSGVLSLTMALMLINPLPENQYTEFVHYAEIGIALAICIAGTIIGVASALPSKEACYSVSRQPFHSQKIQGLMLLTQSLMQTPIIFAFIVALFIKAQLASITTAAESVRLIASGLCIGVGSIGPAIGLSSFSKEACKGIGVNPQAYQQILSFTLVSEALIESPLIFALIISLILLQVSTAGPLSFLRGTALFSSGLVMGMGTFGVGVASGWVASQACKQIAFDPEQATVIARLSLFAQVLIETCSIYSMIVALALILV